MADQVITPPANTDEKPPLTVEQYKAIVDERNAKNAKLKAENDAYTAELTKYRQAEAERAAKEQEAATAKLTEQGKFQEVLKNTETKWQQTNESTASTYEKKMTPLLIEKALRESKIPVVPTAVGDISEALQGRIGFDRKTGEAFVKGPDGKPLVDEKLNPVSIAQFLDGYVTERPHYKADQMVQGTGMRPGARGAINNAQFTISKALASRAVAEAWQAADPKGFDAAFEAHRLNSIRKNRTRTRTA